MLSKVLEIVRNYMDDIESAKEEIKNFNNNKIQMYLPDVQEQLYRKEENRIKEALSEKKEQAIDDVNDVFNEIHYVIQEIVSKPVPANALTTLEMMKTRQTVTAFEVKSILERFKSNYLASVTIYEFFDVEHKVWGKDLFIPRADDLESRIDALYEDIVQTLMNISAFHENLGTSFTAAVLYNGDVINNLNSDLQAFISCFKD